MHASVWPVCSLFLHSWCACRRRLVCGLELTARWQERGHVDHVQGGACNRGHFYRRALRCHHTPGSFPPRTPCQTPAALTVALPLQPGVFSGRCGQRLCSQSICQCAYAWSAPLTSHCLGRFNLLTASFCAMCGLQENTFTDLDTKAISLLGLTSAPKDSAFYPAWTHGTRLPHPWITRRLQSSRNISKKIMKPTESLLPALSIPLSPNHASHLSSSLICILTSPHTHKKRSGVL